MAPSKTKLGFCFAAGAKHLALTLWPQQFPLWLAAFLGFLVRQITLFFSKLFNKKRFPSLWPSTQHLLVFKSLLQLKIKLIGKTFLCFKEVRGGKCKI